MSNFDCPPVLLVGFNRPECLKKVMSIVRLAKPSSLFLALDHPRANRSDDIDPWKRCENIFEEVDWMCDVHRDYAKDNLGCGERMQSAITWAFKSVDRLIILEDDCVPHISFFRFCAELLERYKYDSRVGMIAGHDEHLHMNRIETYGDSYYFDRMTNIWGWATWKRAWDKYDPEMKDWPFFAETRILKNIFPRKYHVTDWIGYSGRLYRKERKTWAGKWAMTMYREHWLSIHPSKNLIQNIGNGISSRSNASLEKLIQDETSIWQNRPVYEMQFPLQHPRTMIPNTLSEFYHMEDIHSAHWWRHVPTSPADFVRKWKRLLKKLRK